MKFQLFAATVSPEAWQLFVTLSYMKSVFAAPHDPVGGDAAMPRCTYCPWLMTVMTGWPTVGLPFGIGAIHVQNVRAPVVGDVGPKPRTISLFCPLNPA